MQNPPTSQPPKRQSTTLVFAICAPLILFSINLPPTTASSSNRSSRVAHPPFSKPPHVFHSPPQSVRDSLHRRGNLQPQSATEPDTATPILRLRDPPPRSGSAKLRPGPYRLLAHSRRPQRAVSSRHLRRRRARLHATDVGVVRDHDTVAAETAGATCDGRAGCFPLQQGVEGGEWGSGSVFEGAAGVEVYDWEGVGGAESVG